MHRSLLVACVVLVSLGFGQFLAAEPALKEVFRGDFRIGVAVDTAEIKADGHGGAPSISHHFNSVSPCNFMKWEPFNPKPGVYRTEAADAFVDFGERNDMLIVGHVLFWHKQTPAWVFQDEQGNPVTREVLLERMRERVRFVAKRYGKRIGAWDVVNESIENDGRLRQSKWVKIIGDDFIEQAFRIAGEELPAGVELLYNDFSMATPAKRQAVVRMIRDLKAKGLRIDGVGMQGHWALDSPKTKQIEQSIVAYADAGVKVHITELDIDVLPRTKDMWNPAVAAKLEKDPKLDPYRDGLPDEVQAKLAKRYADLFDMFLQHRDKIERITFWGLHDGTSWLNQFPIKGCVNHPLLFDRDGKPKPAFHAVVAAKSEKRAP